MAGCSGSSESDAARQGHPGTISIVDIPSMDIGRERAAKRFTAATTTTLPSFITHRTPVNSTSMFGADRPRRRRGRRDSRARPGRRSSMSKQLGRGRRGGRERLRGRHARLHEPPELARVLAEHRIDGVGSHPSFTPALTARRDGLEVALDVVLAARRPIRREAELVLRVDVVAIVIDGRHPHRAALHHLRERLVVDIGAVLDRVGAGADRVAHAGWRRRSGSRPSCPARARRRRSLSSRRK